MLFSDLQVDPQGPYSDGLCWYAFQPQEQWGLIICPEPTCLAERNGANAAGYAVLFGASQQPTAVAVPCDRHRTFVYRSGWYGRFCDALGRRRKQMRRLG